MDKINGNEEDEKESEKKMNISKSDTMSIKSMESNSSAKKSHQKSNRKIRGFNFKNHINVKQYFGNETTNPNNNKQNK